MNQQQNSTSTPSASNIRNPELPQTIATSHAATSSSSFIKPFLKRSPSSPLSSPPISPKKIALMQEKLIEDMELKNAAIRQIIYNAQLKRHAENMALAKTITGKTDEQLTREVNGLVEKAKVLNDLEKAKVSWNSLPAPTSSLAQALVVRPSTSSPSSTPIFNLTHASRLLPGNDKNSRIRQFFPVSPIQNPDYSE
ncbi:hypothetical protein CRE_24585 [Caenorhabditis remanei]|uniref:Uncharacterized protein n=1 Tax=Caenorhabditis remanei TaxID=31234 RepID=E3MVB0_CAERE|nr:hypothetical protein CRE_24585 [Caenorhabditis remanei]